MYFKYRYTHRIKILWWYYKKYEQRNGVDKIVNIDIFNKKLKKKVPQTFLLQVLLLLFFFIATDRYIIISFIEIIKLEIFGTQSFFTYLLFL